MSGKITKLFINHTVSDADLAAVTAMRMQSAPFKGMVNGPQGRDSYDQVIESTSAATGVLYQNDSVGGVSGVWCRVAQPMTAAAILFLHGGGYVVGTAKAYRYFAGQFAAHSGVDVFVADYGLAPERPFPNALNDARAAYAGLIAMGYRRIAVVGDSAGGGLALSLVADLYVHGVVAQLLLPRCCVAMSPWTDLALTGRSFKDNAEAELYLTPAAVDAFAQQYLAGHNAYDPEVSPLYGVHDNLPPIQIHVGTSEILLSDSLEYVKRVASAGSIISAHVWDAMPHVFPNAITMLEAADSAMMLMSEFVQAHVS